MHFEFIESIAHIDASEWDALWPSDYPFTRHAFFQALEDSDSTTEASGWQPLHCIAKKNGALIFAMPLFLKTHSYGEYVFDWAWADAYERNGYDYYPKLVNAIPFTPATGPRWACRDEVNDAFFSQLQTALIDQANHLRASSIHVLFPDAHSRSAFSSSTSDARLFIERQGYQYHWFNNNYADFNTFLSEFSSRKRKNIKKERQKVADYNIVFKPAHEVSEEEWQLFYYLYHRTYFKRSGRPGYLGETFFLNIAQSMPNNIVLAQAQRHGETIAGAVYFQDKDCLYGRYWGTTEDVDGLHFETCYYKGIEYAIQNKLKRFDPGAQGEHKIQRGFQPISTCSYHWLADHRFHSAVHEFCEKEQQENQHYIDHARSFLPFKEDTKLVPTHSVIGQ